MNKFFKFFLGAVVIAVSTIAISSCTVDQEEDIVTPTVHNGGSGK